MVSCAIWCLLYNLKNVKNTHGAVSLLVKSAALLKVTLLHECFSRFLNCTDSIKSRKASHILCSSNFTVDEAGIYLLKFKSRNTRTRCEICSKLPIKIPERLHWRCSGIFIANFEHISPLVLVSPLLTLNMQLPAGWSLLNIFWYISKWCEKIWTQSLVQ